MIRVRDLERSLDFYSTLLGMRLLRRNDYPDGRFTLAFVGYGEESDDAVVELTHNWDREEPYVVGDAWGHLAIGVDDIQETCARLVAAGVPLPRPPGPMKHGSTLIAFVEDPDGRKIELIERRSM